MTKQLPLKFPTVTAPRWEDSPVEWACWYLRENPQVYREFRRLCDDARKRNPDIVLSADMVMHVIRWNTATRAYGDTFHVNDHATALFARLYKLERPEAKFRSRKSIFDMLTPAEERRLMDAFESVRLGIRERWP